MYVVTLHLTFFLEKNPLIPNTWRIFKVTYFMNSPLKGRKKSYRKPLQANSTYNLHRKLDCQNSNLPHHRHTPRYSLSHHKSHLVSTHFRGNLKIYFKKGIAGFSKHYFSVRSGGVGGPSVRCQQVRLCQVWARFGLGLGLGLVSFLVKTHLWSRLEFCSQICNKYKASTILYYFQPYIRRCQLED